MDRSCCFSYADLFRGAYGRPWTGDEQIAFEALAHDARNDWVRALVARTSGAFAAEDRRGTDGLVYAAFWAVEDR